MAETLAEKAREAADDLASWEAFAPTPDDDEWWLVTPAGMDAIRRMAEVVAALAASMEGK